MIKKALILAAGIGNRLGEHTKDKPKCLVEVNEKPILEYQLEALIENGINEVVIVLGYKADKIKEFIKRSKFKDLKIKFIENKEFNSSNSSYSFWLASDEVKDESYIHLNCDIIFFSSLLKKLIESKYKNVIVIDKKIKLTDNMEQVHMEDDKIIHMQNTLLEGSVGKATGVGKFSSENIFWIKNRAKDYISKGDKNQNHYGIIREAVKHLNFYGLDAGDEVLFEINSVNDLNNAHAILSSLHLQSL